MNEKYPTIWVRWLDTSTTNNFNIDSDDIKKERPVLIETVGFLVDEDEECYKLADFVQFYRDGGANDVYRYVHVIPKCSVLNIKKGKIS